LAAILIGAIEGPFHQSLVAIGPVVSEEKIKMWKFMTYDGRRTLSDGKSSHDLWPGELKTDLITKNWCKFNKVSRPWKRRHNQAIRTGTLHEIFVLSKVTY
jgi:hypothetical protein